MIVTALSSPSMSEELLTLRRAIVAYTLTKPGAVRASMERIVDDLEKMIREGRNFDDLPTGHPTTWR